MHSTDTARTTLRGNPALAAALSRTPAAVCRFAGVYDGISARVAVDAGMKALWLSGLGVSAAAGMPDDETLTPDELLRAVASVRRVTAVPLLVDCNAGFGDAHRVRSLTQAASRLGVAGVSLEDKAFPRENSLHDDTLFALEDSGRFAGKLEAARYAAGDGLTVVARTEGLIAGLSIEETLRRADTYRGAGADAIIVHCKDRTPERVLEFATRWGRRAPLIVIPTTYPQLSLTQAAHAGVDGVIFANQPMRAAVTALRSLLGELPRARRLADARTPLAPLDSVLRLHG